MKKIFIFMLIVCIAGCSAKKGDDKNQIIKKEEQVATVNMNKVAQNTQIYNVYIKKQAPLSKYEPENSIYNGVFIDEESDFIEQFEKYTNTNHSVYLKNIYLTDSFPLSFVLSCYSNLKTPFITILPPNSQNAFSNAEIIRLAKEFGNLHIPIFVNMYPLTDNMKKNSEKYIKFLQDASTYFKLYAPNVSFVWCVDYKNAYEAEKYYAGDSYIDWVGLNIAEDIKENDNIEKMFKQLDFLYKKFAYKKPIFLNLSISHFGGNSYRYLIDEKINEIRRYFNTIPYKYPKLKMLNYINLDNFKDDITNKQNYLITDNKKILKAYQDALKDNIYSDVVVFEAKESAIQSTRADIVVYKIGYNFYIDEKHFKNNKNLKKTNMNGKNYYNLDDILNIYKKQKKIDIKNKNIIIF